MKSSNHAALCSLAAEHDYSNKSATIVAKPKSALNSGKAKSKKLSTSRFVRLAPSINSFRDMPNPASNLGSLNIEGGPSMHDRTIWANEGAFPSPIIVHGNHTTIHIGAINYNDHYHYHGSSDVDSPFFSDGNQSDDGNVAACGSFRDEGAEWQTVEDLSHDDNGADHIDASHSAKNKIKQTSHAVRLELPNVSGKHAMKKSNLASNDIVGNVSAVVAAMGNIDLSAPLAADSIQSTSTIQDGADSVAPGTGKKSSTKATNKKKNKSKSTPDCELNSLSTENKGNGLADNIAAMVSKQREQSLSVPSPQTDLANMSFLLGVTNEKRFCRFCMKTFTDRDNVRQVDGSSPCSYHPGTVPRFVFAIKLIGSGD